MFRMIVLILLLNAPPAWCLALKEMTLGEQIERADKIALVRIVEAKKPFLKSSRKDLLVEVLDGILNSEKGEIIKLLGSTGIAESDIDFDCLGGKAIVIMKKMNPNFAYKGFYGSVNQYLSVYHVERGHVSGFGFSKIRYEEAVEKIKEKLDSQNIDY